MGEVSKAKRSIDVSFVNLANTEEYRNILPLQSVHLGDTVTIEYREFGVNTKMRVVKTEYDVLAEHYNALTLGSQFNVLY